MFDLYTCFDDPESRHPRKSPFWGTIYITSNGKNFPFDDWYDALSGVLSMWLCETAAFISKKYKTPCELYFMDGPYYIRLFPTEQEGVISAKFFNDDKVVQVDEDIHFQEFVQKMLDASEMLLADKGTRKFKSATKELRGARDRLLNAIAGLQHPSD